MKSLLITILSISVALMLISGCVASLNATYSPENADEYATDEESLVGGFSEFREPEEYEIEIFNSIMENYDSEIIYTPVSVRTQIVAGLNYIFLAVAEPQSENEESYEVEVKIYQPLSDGPELIEIIKR